jgi:hypothetical protein
MRIGQIDNTNDDDDDDDNNNNDNNSNFTLPNIVSNKRLDKSYLLLQLAKIIVPINVPVGWQGIKKYGP